MTFMSVSFSLFVSKALAVTLSVQMATAKEIHGSLTRPLSPATVDRSDAMSQTEQEMLKEQGFFDKVGKWRGWLSFFILSIVVSAVLVAPGVYLYIFHPFNADAYPNPFITGVPVSILTGAEFQVIRWSFWITCCWLLYVVTSFVLDALPAVLERLISFFWGTCSDSVRQKLILVLVLKPWIHSSASFVLAVVTFKVFFLQVEEVPEWKSFYNVLISIMVASIIFMFQRIYVQNIAENFHQVAYEERIKQSKRAIFMLENLRKAIRGFGLARVFDNFGKESESENLEVPEPVADDHDDLPRAEPKKGSFVDLFKTTVLRKPKSNSLKPQTPYHETIEIERVDEKKPINIIEVKREKENRPSLQAPGADLSRRNTKTSSRSEKIVAPSPDTNDTLKIGSNDKKKGGFNLDLYSDENAEDLAIELFRALETNEKSEVELRSFYEHFESPKDAKEAFDLFDRNGNGSVDLVEMKWACKRIYREKKSLSESLGDVSQALGNLNKILYFFSIILTLIVCAPLYNISFQTIVPFTSILLALSFVFGGTAKNTFECIIFLFVYHPYDVGDRIFVDGRNYIVKELSILQTTFMADGKRVYIPNGTIPLIIDIMSKKEIWNARRSEATADYINVKVDINTPEDTLRLIHAEVKEFLAQNSREYRPTCMMDIMEMGQDSDMMTVRFSIDMHSNWQDAGKRWAVRTKYMFKLKEILMNRGIRFIVPTQEVRIVNSSTLVHP